MQSKKTYIVGNWKMYGDAAMAEPLAKAVAQQAAKTASAEVVLCPPATLLYAVRQGLSGSSVKLGGQDCHEQPEGAFTGDISATMLREAGCGFVIVGHSERRQTHGETNAKVRKKALRAIKSGLIPIVCIGETGAQRDADGQLQVVEQQLWESVPEEAKSTDFIIAYEPVWAIGSGRTPTADDIAAMHSHIARLAAKKTGLAKAAVPVLYGGSVKAANAREILAIEGVSGVLVGGASLKAEEFCKIIEMSR